MNVNLMMARQAISALAWEKARWRDGRPAIVAPLQTDMAMQGPMCRVMPAWPHRTAWSRKIIGPQPHEEAIVMTWDEAAVVLMQPVAMFGIDFSE